MPTSHAAPRVHIVCGGTGGHFFPGVAVARELQRAGVIVTLLISEKRVDQQAAQSQGDLEICELPAVSWQTRAPWRFLNGLIRSLRKVRTLQLHQRPDAVLAMGGFTSVAPVLMARAAGVPVFLHESNAIPGRANRWLAPLAHQVFVGFESARHRFLHTHVEVTGTPVRDAFFTATCEASRVGLGLDAGRPVLLIMGGSQGARAINHRALAVLPALLKAWPSLQFLHLCGGGDGEEARVRAAYEAQGATARVHEFHADMPLVLAAADVAVGRAGASSLAELAAARLPSVLIALPTAADDHQRYNAREFERRGAARMVEQSAGPEELAQALCQLLANRAPVRAALAGMAAPRAAAQVAAHILSCVRPQRSANAPQTWNDPTLWSPITA